MDNFFTRLFQAPVLLWTAASMRLEGSLIGFYYLENPKCISISHTRHYSRTECQKLLHITKNQVLKKKLCGKFFSEKGTKITKV